MLPLRNRTLIPRYPLPPRSALTGPSTVDRADSRGTRRAKASHTSPCDRTDSYPESPKSKGVKPPHALTRERARRLLRRPVRVGLSLIFAPRPMRKADRIVATGGRASRPGPAERAPAANGGDAARKRDGCRTPFFDPTPGCDLRSRLRLHVLALELPQLSTLLAVRNTVPRIRSGS